MKLGGLEGSLLCPVQFLKRYLVLHPKIGRSLLAHESGAVVTQYQFRMVLRKCLKMLGLQECCISMHSFRICAGRKLFGEFWVYR